MAAIAAVAIEVDAPTATRALACPEVGAADRRHTYRLPKHELVLPHGRAPE